MTAAEMAVLDPEEARRLAEEGIAKVRANANPAWLAEALEAVYNCCLIYEDFTADQVWELLKDCPEEIHNPSALGPVFKSAAKKEWMTRKVCPHCKSKITRTCQRGPRHGAPINVWESLL